MSYTKSQRTYKLLAAQYLITLLSKKLMCKDKQNRVGKLNSLIAKFEQRKNEDTSSSQKPKKKIVIPKKEPKKVPEVVVEKPKKKVEPTVQVDNGSLSDEIANEIEKNIQILLTNLKGLGCPTKFSERNEYVSSLKSAPKKINSYEDAALFLFPDNETVKETIKEKREIAKKKREEEEELERQKESMAVKYPGQTVGTYYRGDSRKPKDIESKGGFTGYKKLTTQEAIAMAKQWFGDGGLGPVAYHQDWISNKTGGDKIATGNDIGCMGYGCTGPEGAVRNVYQIIVPKLKKISLTEETLGVKPHKDVEDGKAPDLLINASTLEAATIIGVGGARAEETTFFTTLEWSWIKHVYEKEGNNDESRGWLEGL